MQVQTNQFLAALRKGDPQIGLWASLANPFAFEAIAGAGFDWLLIDMEHAPNDLTSVMAQLQVAAAYDGTAIVRPPWNDTVMVKRLLDAGAPGLLFPMVQTMGEAERAVASCRYPPRGVRGVGGVTRANRYGRITDYFTRTEDETAVLLQVETLSALKQANEIGETDGVDGVFFGPADIGADMGILGRPLDPAIWEVIRPVAKGLRERGIPTGTLVTDPEFARRLLDEGFAFVACGLDTALLARGADALIASMRKG